MLMSFAFTALPVSVSAEEPPEVLYEVNETQNREQLLREESRRVNAVVNDYFNRMQVAEKLDNDIRYLLTKSRGLTGEELSRYLDKYVMPRNDELLQHASQVTTRSSVLRELNGLFIAYATARAEVLDTLIGLGRIKMPAAYYAEFSSASFGGFAYASSSVAVVDEHVPAEVTLKISKMRSLLSQLYAARSEYLNRKAYILRNKAELIQDEK